MWLRSKGRQRARGRLISAAVGAAAVGIAAAPARASISVGGMLFANNAFADQLVRSTGSFTTSGGSLSDVLVGPNTSDYAYSFDPGANLVMRFTDNVIFNGTGADLAVFDLGAADAFQLAVNVDGTTHFYTTTSTGLTTGAGVELNVARIDLSDYALPAGALVDTIQVYADVSPSGLTSTSFTSFTAFGAINSATLAIPEPVSAGWMVGGAIVLRRRRRGRAA